jgi:hypothetical protein
LLLARRIRVTFARAEEFGLKRGQKKSKKDRADLTRFYHPYFLPFRALLSAPPAPPRKSAAGPSPITATAAATTFDDVGGVVDFVASGRSLGATGRRGSGRGGAGAGWCAPAPPRGACLTLISASRRGPRGTLRAPPA